MVAILPYPVIRLNAKIPQGATYKGFDFTYYQSDGVTPFDLTGYSARMHFRAKHSDPDPPLYEADSTGDITLGGATGKIQVVIPAATTAAWTFKCAVYDLELIEPDGEVVRLLEGIVHITPEVTRV